MPTKIESEDGEISVDTYCPTCGGDAIPLLGRECDCSLPENVVCSAVIEHPNREEPFRTTLTRDGDLAVDSLLEAALRGFLKAL